jgi:two-component system, response regulator RegA
MADRKTRGASTDERKASMSHDPRITEESISGGANAPTILVIDEQDQFIDQIQRLLTEQRYKMRRVRSFAEAMSLLRAMSPMHIISEVQVGGASLVEFARDPDVLAVVPIRRLVVLTAYPSVAAAVRFGRLGVGGYLAKPVSGDVLRMALTGEAQEAPPADEPLVWPSLDRTIWEYLNQVHACAGSISEAARRLNVDRHSLRRMLAKLPPRR